MPALLLYGDTVRHAALRHELPLAIIDPLLFAERDGRVSVLTSMLERDRIQRVRPDVQLLDFDDFGFRALLNQGLSFDEAARQAAVQVVRELGIEHAVVPGEFPLALGDALRAAGVSLDADDAVVAGRRRVKAAAELDGIRTAQRAAEAGMGAAAELLAQARGGENGRLELDGRVLLSEDVRAVIRAACAERGAPCPPDVMVGSVWQGYGHEPGYGPLPAGLPIVIDLWPCHEASACWADMTRTFLVGQPTPQVARVIAERERLVRTALEQARAAIAPGVTGRELHDATCDLFEAAGYATQRTASGDQTDGFQFSLGHGVGLEVHEAPSLGLAGREPLVPGDVVALEPGLYDAEIGGVRLEDLVLVTQDGSETLTQYPYDLTP
jgi:Xaa-Pro aminopeptidase